MRLWCGHCKRKRAHRANGAGMLICRACGRYRELPNAPRDAGAVAPILHADVVRDFEDRIAPHILRNWDRERIVRFAKHLLGDECQQCPKHNAALTGGEVVPSNVRRVRRSDPRSGA